MTLFYGLTGGIGAGKSTVAKIFSNKGVPVLDLDHIGRGLINTADLKQSLIKSFGEEILEQGKIQRQKLASVAFQSSSNTELLNSIMHPAIKQAEQRWKKQQYSPFAIIEASVLIESGGVARMDGLISVLTDMKKRKDRVLKRGQQTEDIFESIVKQQCSDIERKQLSEFILYNNHDIQLLKESVEKLHQTLISSIKQ